MTTPAFTPNMIRPRKVAPVEQPKVGNAKSRRKARRASEANAATFEALKAQHEARVDNHPDPDWRGPLTYRPFVGLDGLVARAAKE